MTATVGRIVDALGVAYALGDGELVEAAVVILKTVDERGHVGLTISHSPGMSWVERIGMLHAASELKVARIIEENRP